LEEDSPRKVTCADTEINVFSETKIVLNNQGEQRRYHVEINVFSETKIVPNKKGEYRRYYT